MNLLSARLVPLMLVALVASGCSSVAHFLGRRPSLEWPGVAPDSVQVFLLAGQSNMSGRGVVAAEDETTHPRVYALTARGGWALARDPVHFDKPRLAGVGPGLTFGKTMADAQPAVSIGLIPGAIGGVSITRWVPDVYDRETRTHPYDDAVARAHAVLDAHGETLTGVLWDQGEADGRRTADEYETLLVGLVERLRAEFGNPDLPFVAAQKAPFYVTGHPGAANVNEAIARLPGRLPHTAFVTTEGLTDKGDGTHLDAASARELGRRFAAAMERLLSTQP